MKEKLPPESDITEADNKKAKKFARNVLRSIEKLNFQIQTDESIENPLCELLGFDKELKKIRGQLKVSAAKKPNLKEKILEEKEKLAENENYPEYTGDQREEIRNRITRLNDEL